MKVQMFIDITPGTPPIYRLDALTKLLTVGYDIHENIIFGTDCYGENYSIEKATKWLKIDKAILRKLKLSRIADNIYCENFRRFIGLSDSSRPKYIPTPVED